MADEKRTFSGERNSKRNNRVISPSKYLLDDAKVSADLSAARSPLS